MARDPDRQLSRQSRLARAKGTPDTFTTDTTGITAAGRCAPKLTVA
jgi:hypothetical protein